MTRPGDRHGDGDTAGSDSRASGRSGAGPDRARLAARTPGWPAVAGPLPSGAGEVRLRPLLRSDGAAWRRIRLADRSTLMRWEVTSRLPWDGRHTAAEWRRYRRAMLRAARAGSMLPMAITVAGDFAGQVTVGGIVRGALGSGWIGYWVDAALRRRGVATAAVALGLAHALGPGGLHRVEATIDPANAASLATVRGLGMRREGLLRRYLDVDGAWRDHELFAITVEEVPVVPVDPGGGVAETAAALVARGRTLRENPHPRACPPWPTGQL